MSRTGVILSDVTGKGLNYVCTALVIIGFTIIPLVLYLIASRRIA